MLKIEIYIIFLPFIFSFFSSILFLFSQLIFKKKYFLKLLASIVIIFFIFLFFIYKTKINFSDVQIFYLIFVYLCNSFIFLNIIQACISSLQLAVLKMIYFKPGISRKKVISKYSPVVIFEQRIKRLIAADIISLKKNYFVLKNTKILFVLNFFNLLKKTFDVNN
jgi:hypothetical protein